ncbi:hypothetical protein MNV49_002238 [Pseudohyphozyma bogoriensis]|nr:hypothetical protein MNV49_002238 [Pseudohyphozyma bogoriensis]
MSKRGAEKQLTDRNWDRDDDDGDEGSETGSFKTAPKEEIAVRKYVHFPFHFISKPAFGGATPFGTFGPISTGSSPSPSPPNPFATSSTGGFGSSTTSSFNFTTPASSTATPATNGSGFSFPQSKPAAPAASAPAAAPAATTFASAGFTFPSPPKSSNTPPALTYYMSLRSLNLALIESIRKEVEKDPFVDLAGDEGLGKIRDKYEEHKRSIVKEFEASGGKEEKTNGTKAPAVPIPAIFTTPPPAASTATPPPPTFSFTPAAEAPKPKAKSPPPASTFSLPTPPSTFTFGGNVVKPPSTTPSTPVTGGFVFDAGAKPDPYAEKSAFAFPPPAATPAPASTPAPTPAASSAPKTTLPAAVAKVKSSTAPAAPSPLRFGESVSPPSSPAKEEPKKDALPAAKFSFGASFGALAKGAETTASTTSPSTTAPPVSIPIPAPSTPSFSFGTPAPSTPSAMKPFAPSSPPITTAFGTGASPPTFGFGAALGSKPPPVASSSAGFSFGGSSPAAASTGFSFGSSSATPAFGSSAPAKTTVGFSFGAPAAAPAAAPAVEEKKDEATPEASADETAFPVGTKPFGERGEGEENEKSLFEVRGRLKVGNEEGEGVICKVEVKEDSTTGVKRLLARNDVTARVAINFRITKDLPSNVGLEGPKKTFIRFLGVNDEGKPEGFRLRVKTAEFAEAFVKALEDAKP